MPVLKDIIFNDIELNNFKISWKIDEIKIINIDNKDVKYKVEIRKENEKFKLIYENKDMNYIINNLNQNTNYEIRICSIYDNINSIWSEIKKVKTDKFDSILLNETNICNEFLNKIYEWTRGKNIQLLYRGRRDSIQLIHFIKDVIIRDQLYLYLKMKMDNFFRI